MQQQTALAQQAPHPRVGSRASSGGATTARCTSRQSRAPPLRGRRLFHLPAALWQLAPARAVLRSIRQVGAVE